MIGQYIRAFALAAAAAFICSPPSASAASYDGAWNMIVQTTNGHCGRIRVGLEIDHGRMYSTRGSFVLHPIRLTGRVSGSGQVKMNAIAGPRIARGTGRFGRVQGSGRWAGTGPSGVCSGFWSASRS